MVGVFSVVVQKEGGEMIDLILFVILGVLFIYQIFVNNKVIKLQRELLEIIKWHQDINDNLSARMTGLSRRINTFFRKGE